MAKRRNPPDATRRNVRASQKRDTQLSRRIMRLEALMEDLAARVERLGVLHQPYAVHQRNLPTVREQLRKRR